MCLLAALDSQGIVVKCTAAIFFRTVDCASVLRIPVVHADNVSKQMPREKRVENVIKQLVHA